MDEEMLGEHFDWFKATFERSPTTIDLETVKWATARERERCAKVCESRQQWVSNGNGLSYLSWDPASVEAGRCADAIRRGDDE